MRSAICAGLCLVSLTVALGGCTKTKVKNSKVEAPAEREVIVTSPGSTTTTTKTEKTETTTTRPPPP
jgi:hypothetical protein